MGFVELFSTDNIILELRSAAKSQLLEEMVDRLIQSQTLDATLRDDVLSALRAREELGSTGIGYGVGIPHAKISKLSSVCAAIGLAPEGVDYRAVDGEPVKIVILILRPEEKAEAHLEFLQWISRLGRNADFRNFMLQSKTAEDVLALLDEMNGV